VHILHNKLSADSEVRVTSVRAADGEAAKLGEGDKAKVVGPDALVPLLEGVGEWVCDSNGREGERDSEVQELHDELPFIPFPEVQVIPKDISCDEKTDCQGATPIIVEIQYLVLSRRRKTTIFSKI